MQGDCRDSSQLQKVFDGVDAVICVLGTSAFPSARYCPSDIRLQHVATLCTCITGHAVKHHISTAKATSQLMQHLHRWKGGNGPEQTDSIATGNLIRATPKGVKRFVLVTSAGVERYNKLPFSILNLFGMLHQSPCRTPSCAVLQSPASPLV